MRLATLRLSGRTAVARVEGERVVEVRQFADVADVLVRDGLAEVAKASGPVHDLGSADLAPVVTNPRKVVCVGLNYRTHILEMGRGLPEFPTLFTKYPEAIIGPRDDIQLAPESQKVDWEAELAVVIGRRVRRAKGEAAREAIAGYTVLNDITMRDFQYRGPSWFQGKSWENSTPLGPVMITPEELVPDAVMTTTVDGQQMQHTTIDDLVFDAPTLVEYISTIITLNPGDVIATGTPSGVGHARKPPQYLQPGQTVITAIEGIGELVNRTVAEQIETGP